ncbi:hypothetical protein [Streptomyces bohaiensis]|uniref:HPP family protein n=1 Tax=Streptomyces bohaiensis TaxID=1431344 RepID=A0ABX1CH85_9ACTN|nr:hypothetical protein [Streptomyces bohaiensis]NJQ16569.1 hypothetical protein [Streptomyces bohaiensis]
MSSPTNNTQPEPLPQRWTIILTAGCLAGVIAFALGAPALGAATAIGATVLGLHKVTA